MKTTTRQCYLNLSAKQARHLHDTGSLLVVEACKPQPTEQCPECGGQGCPYCGPDMHYHTMCINCMCWKSGFVVGDPPLGKPGDVVLCREPWKFLDIMEQRVRYQVTADGVGHNDFRPASLMPEWAIRLRPVIKSVECRRVSDITNEESAAASFPKHDGSIRIGCTERAEFACDWHRRHRRRGPEYAFERAWGFFYTLTLTTE